MRSDEERAVDADIQAAEPPILVKFASVAQGLAGLFVGLTGLQMVDFRWRVEWASYVPYCLLFLGAAGLGMSAMLYRSRRWAGIASPILGAVTALTMVGWLFHVLTNVFSCIMWVAVPLSCLSTILSAVSVGPVLRTAAARRRLSDRGMNLGL